MMFVICVYDGFFCTGGKKKSDKGLLYPLWLFWILTSIMSHKWSYIFDNGRDHNKQRKSSLSCCIFQLNTWKKNTESSDLRRQLKAADISTPADLGDLFPTSIGLSALRFVMMEYELHCAKFTLRNKSMTNLPLNNGDLIMEICIVREQKSAQRMLQRKT